MHFPSINTTRFALVLLTFNVAFLACNHPDSSSNDPVNTVESTTNTSSDPSSSEDSIPSQTGLETPQEVSNKSSEFKNSDKTNEPIQANPCLVRNISDVKIDPIPLLPSTIADQYSKNPTAALRSWLLSTKTFKDSDTSDLKIAEVINNKIYSVSNCNNSFIIKVEFCSNIERLFQLNQTIYAHPECLLTEDHKKTGFPVPSPEDLKKIPRTAKIIEAAKGPYCFTLLERAPGVAVAEYKADLEVKHGFDSSTIDFHTLFGESVGSMHYFFSTYKDNESLSAGPFITWTHGDLHANNIFYDEDSDQFTLVDNSLSHLSTVTHDQSQAYIGIMYGPSQNYISELYGEVNKIAREHYESKTYFWNTSWYALSEKTRNKYFYEAFHRFALQPKVLKTEAKFHQAVSREFAFMKGYLRPWPKELKQRHAGGFKNVCLNIFRNHLMSVLGVEQLDANEKTEHEKDIILLESRISDLAQCVQGKFD